jgi:hypothetical protein
MEHVKIEAQQVFPLIIVRFKKYLFNGRRIKRKRISKGKEGKRRK